MEFKILGEDELQAGDVFLCYSPESEGKAEELRSGYSHAAIKTLRKGILEATFSGIRLSNVGSLFEDYGHIAVLRSEFMRDQEYLEKLDRFAEAQQG